MADRIAVIILNFFGHDDSRACVQSVLSALDGVIFLVDNSVDANEKKFLEEWFEKKDNVYLFFPSRNLGFAAGVNHALRTARQEGFHRFLILNNDAILVQNSGEILEKAYRNHPSSLISPAIKWGSQTVRGSYYHKYLGLISSQPQKSKFGWLQYLTGCALAFDLDFLNKVGYMDASFFMYGEDTEYSHRAHGKKTPLIILKEELVIHEGSKSSRMASFFYEYHVARSHFLLIFRLLSNPLSRIAAIGGKSFVLLMRAIWRCFRYKSFTPISGLLLSPFHLDIKPKR
ncbi:MAG: glycosyltransferase [Desulfobulbaceae bacterium]|nr:glycosyltransferase [Desulfobulbaceae bacterium]